MPDSRFHRMPGAAGGLSASVFAGRLGSASVLASPSWTAGVLPATAPCCPLAGVPATERPDGHGLAVGRARVAVPGRTRRFGWVAVPWVRFEPCRASDRSHAEPALFRPCPAAPELIYALGMAKKPLKFEQALSRLEEIVTAIEQGEIGLEESIERYEEGMGLIRHCRTVLSEAELKIQKLQADADGELKEEPLDVPSDESDSEDE